MSLTLELPPHLQRGSERIKGLCRLIAAGAPDEGLSLRQIEALAEDLLPLVQFLKECPENDPESEQELTDAQQATPWVCTCVYHGRPHGVNGEPAGSLQRRNPNCPDDRAP